MKRSNRGSISVLVLVLLLLAGCATSTPYQKSVGDNVYGYMVRPHIIRPNVFVATFTANCNTTTKQAETYVIRAIKEFCEDPGDLQYRLISDKDIYKGETKDWNRLASSDCSSVQYDRELYRCDSWTRGGLSGSEECTSYSAWTEKEAKREGVVKAWAAFECFQRTK